MNSTGAGKERQFHYRLQGAQGFSLSLTVTLNGETLECVVPQPVTAPWTALEFHQCPNCPLTSAPLCPFAARIEPVVAPLGELLSYDELEVEAVCGDRLVRGKVPAQAAASSLIGLIGATSGCPRTAFLKPLAWFHQPLATEEETIFRAAASWLLAQYFAQEDGKAPDWSLAELKRNYSELQMVNVALAKRLREASDKDASVNAIIRLDMFARAVNWSIEDFLEPLRPLFGPKP